MSAADEIALTRTRDKTKPMSRSEQSIAKRLQESAQKLAGHQRMANAERLRRDLLVMKLIRAGCSERKTAEFAEISGEAVHYIKKRWERTHS